MLKLHAIRKTFHTGTVNEVRALRGVSLHIAPGSFTHVLGGNGSGKSTLLNAVAGSFFVDAGRIELAGHDVTSMPEHRRARHIGRVFQNPFSGTAPDMSILENFAIATRRGQFRGLGWAMGRGLRQQLRDRVATLKMGLEDRLDNAIGSLSGGQRQALTLLMATWVKPDLLLLDEHTAALDPKSADQVIALTQSVVSEHRLTTLMVTHAMSQAVQLGDRILMMHQGNILYDFAGREKERLTVSDLLARFDMIRRRDLLDSAAAGLLVEQYV